MAKFWAGPYPWDRTQYEVTVRTSWYQDRQAWIADMIVWAQERNMRIEWCGESTHTMDDDHWHQAHFYIPDERDRVAFALRWS